MPDIWCALMLKCYLVMFSFVVCPKAPTWDSCNCRWEDWAGWSSCSRSCGGGSQHRQRKVWGLDVPRCDGFESCASKDMGIEERECNMQCFNGGSYLSLGIGLLNSGSCRCVKGSKGLCCEQIVDCGQPSDVTNGHLSYKNTTYNNTLEIMCDADYNLTDVSQKTRTCTEYGYWSGINPECLYVASCKSDPCHNKATCTNTLGDYTCICLPGWTGKNCETDIQPPVVSSCTKDREIVTSNLTSYQSWPAPQFSDPFGNNVKVTTNYPNNEYLFPWGAFTVIYTGLKENNGLHADCTFTVKVKPHPCPALPVPTNGYVVCNGWRSEYAQVCRRLCFTGYSLPPGYTDEIWYNCGATGNWLPMTPGYGCVKQAIKLNGFQRSNTPLAAKCPLDEYLSDVRTYYIDELKLSALNPLCEEYPKHCAPNNVSVTC